MEWIDGTMETSRRSCSSELLFMVFWLGIVRTCEMATGLDNKTTVRQ